MAVTVRYRGSTVTVIVWSGAVTVRYGGSHSPYRGGTVAVTVRYGGSGSHRQVHGAVQWQSAVMVRYRGSTVAVTVRYMEQYSGRDSSLLFFLPERPTGTLRHYRKMKGRGLPLSLALPVSFSQGCQDPAWYMQV